ncbi:hypothetical protein G6F68_016668 [Rhizopus microsporus]|nr:hypothetical protein G6F68_016668 [Rhizopus microsporus]
MAPLVDQPAYAQCKQRARVLHRDRVVELLPGMADGARLQVQRSVVALDTHAHRSVLGAAIECAHVVDVALRHRDHPVRGGAPAIAADEEFAFDFDAHRAIMRDGHDSPSALLEHRDAFHVCGVREHVHGTGADQASPGGS